MNEQIEAIRNEIKRRMEKHWDLLPDADSPEDDWTHNELCELGAYKELERLETFVDSLPESNRPELSDNLDEAARLYAIPHYMKDIDVHHIEEYPYDTGLEAAFIAGAQWMAGQGVILNLSIDEFSCGAYNACVEQGLTSEDDVIVQIRKA